MPNRILKEKICTSDDINELTWFEEVLFYRLIVNCDDYGRYDGRPAIIKNQLFPLKENLTLKSVSEALNKLVDLGLVSLYEYEGRRYLYLPTWGSHQNVRAKRSKYPAPDESKRVNAYDSTCMHMNSDDSTCEQMNAYVPVIRIQSESESVSLSESEKNPNPNAHPREGSPLDYSALAEFSEKRGKHEMAEHYRRRAKETGASLE